MSAEPDHRNRRTTNTRQRKKQQHLLDVKIRASTEHRRRVSAIFGITCKLILIGAFGTGAWIGGKEALRHFVWENPDYYVRDVKVTTDGSLTREQILKAGEIVEGGNIFQFNLSRARAEIEKLPQVESAEVTRTLPNKLSVLVTERRPIAWLVSKPDEDPTSSDKSFLVDARGTVMKSRVKLEEYLHFPVISGVSTENLVPGERVTSVEMQAALELIQTTSDSTRFQARHVDISKGYCLIVTDHNRARITFGLDRLDAQLSRLHRYLARAADDQQEIQTVNLLVERNTPVTFNAPPADPNATPDPVKPPESKMRAGLPVSEAARFFPTATPPRALAVSTPAPAAPPIQKQGFLSLFKAKATPTPAARRVTHPVSKKPFRLNP
jgi:cell division septal protein FtsQ